MESAGPHQRTTVRGTKDVNGLTMVSCLDCQTTAHAKDEATAKADLAKTRCAPDCQNCKNLRASYKEDPAVPLLGTKETLLHVCPNDGNRWWQSNDYYHIWQQVTNDEAWNTLQSCWYR